MIPNFDHTGNLPPGIHSATWDEIVAQFGFNEHRKRLLKGLQNGIKALQMAGCKCLYIDGSFVTCKQRPGDFDACWEEAGVDVSKLDPVLMTFTNKREAQQKKYNGEFFPATTVASPFPLTVFVDFFQRDKNTGLPKGIIKLNI